MTRMCWQRDGNTKRVRSAIRVRDSMCTSLPTVCCSLGVEVEVQKGPQNSCALWFVFCEPSPYQVWQESAVLGHTSSDPLLYPLRIGLASVCVYVLSCFIKPVVKKLGGGKVSVSVGSHCRAALSSQTQRRGPIISQGLMDWNKHIQSAYVSFCVTLGLSQSVAFTMHN